MQVMQVLCGSIAFAFICTIFPLCSWGSVAWNYLIGYWDDWMSDYNAVFLCHWLPRHRESNKFEICCTFMLPIDAMMHASCVCSVTYCALCVAASDSAATATFEPVHPATEGNIAKRLFIMYGFLQLMPEVSCSRDFKQQKWPSRALEWCHSNDSIGYIRFPISLPLLRLCFALFPRYYYLFPKS